MPKSLIEIPACQISYYSFIYWQVLSLLSLSSSPKCTAERDIDITINWQINQISSITPHHCTSIWSSAMLLVLKYRKTRLIHSFHESFSLHINILLNHGETTIAILKLWCNCTIFFHWLAKFYFDSVWDRLVTLPCGLVPSDKTCCESEFCDYQLSILKSFRLSHFTLTVGLMSLTER